MVGCAKIRKNIAFFVVICYNDIRKKTAASVISLNGNPHDGSFFCHGGGMYFVLGALSFAVGFVVCIVEFILRFTGGFDAVIAYAFCGASFLIGVFFILPVFNCVTINDRVIERRCLFGIKRVYRWDLVTKVKIYKGITRVSGRNSCSEIVKIYVNGRRILKIDEDYTDFAPLLKFIRKTGDFPRRSERKSSAVNCRKRTQTKRKDVNGNPRVLVEKSFSSKEVKIFLLKSFPCVRELDRIKKMKYNKAYG